MAGAGPVYVILAAVKGNMAKKVRKLKTGDRVTIEVSIIDVWHDMGFFTVDINGQRTKIPCDWNHITKVVPHDPRSIYKTVS